MIIQCYCQAGCLTVEARHVPESIRELASSASSGPGYVVLDKNNRLFIKGDGYRLHEAKPEGTTAFKRVHLLGRKRKAFLTKRPVSLTDGTICEWTLAFVRERIEVGDREILLPGGWDPPHGEKFAARLDDLAAAGAHKTLAAFAVPGSAIDGYPNSQAAMDAARYRGYAVQRRLTGQIESAIIFERRSEECLREV